MDHTVTPLDQIAGKVAAARAAYAAGTTRPLAWRKATLARMRELLGTHEDRLLQALAADFGKPAHEAWVTEIGFVLADIDFVLTHLPAWMQPEKVATPVASKPGVSYIVPEPVGVACVIAPWNYPVQLLLSPIVAAVAAGNAVVAKPSELAPHASAALAALIADIGDPAIAVVEGGVAETATVIGNVRLKSNASVWFGSVLRGDNELIEIGVGSNVQDNCTIHTDPGFPLTIGQNCTIGHNVILDGCTVEDGALIGMGAIVMNGARIGAGCVIGAGAVITEGKQFEPRSLVVGAPARVVRTLTPEQVAALTAGAPVYIAKGRRYKTGLKRIG